MPEYQGKEVKLNKPFRTPNGPKKFSVYVKNDKGNVVKVNFGDPDMEIKRDDPERRKAYRSRHNCKDPGPKWKANYWSCKFWSGKSVSDLLGESILKEATTVEFYINREYSRDPKDINVIFNNRTFDLYNFLRLAKKDFMANRVLVELRNLMKKEMYTGSFTDFIVDYFGDLDNNYDLFIRDNGKVDINKEVGWQTKTKFYKQRYVASTNLTGEKRMKNFLESDKNAKEYIDEMVDQSFDSEGRHLGGIEYRGRTTLDADHEHDYVVDKDGNGNTISTYPREYSDAHTHTIKNFELSKGSDGHTHYVSKTNPPYKK